MSTEDIKFYKDLIRFELFPQRLFPRHLFPNIDQIVLNNILTKLQSDTKLKRYIVNSSDNKISNYLKKHFTIHNILLENPNEFILIFREYIRRFASYKHFDKSEVDDVVQDIITCFLTEKIFRIQKNYRREMKKSENFLSYFATVLHNTYIEVLKKNRKTVKIIDKLKVDNLKTNYLIDEMYDYEIDVECSKLDKILSLYYRKWPVLLLSVLIKNRITVSIDFINSLFPQMGKKDKALFIENYDETPIQEIFDKLSTSFNQFETKILKSSSILRRGIRFQEEIICKLNLLNQEPIYNDEVFVSLLQIHMEKYTTKIRSIDVKESNQ